MGYYTYHKLEIIKGGDFSIDYEKEISDYAGYDNCFEGEIKWYDCEKDMREFSKKHPNTTFCVIGTGEENGDMWKAYFRRGKMKFCKAIITFPDYNENELG